MFRKERVGELLLGFLSQAIRELDDSRIALVTVTDIKVSPDLKYAQVFWSMPTWKIEKNVDGTEKRTLSFPSETEKTELEQILNSHKSRLKHAMASELNLRYTPELRFSYDTSEENGAKIDSLLKS